METQHRVKWTVSLSNGETFFEGLGKFADIPNEPSPWQRLIAYTINKKAEITSLALFVGQDPKERHYYHIPSVNNPRFKEFDALHKPLDYNVCRKMSRNIYGPQVTVTGWYTVAEAFYTTYKLQIWVDEMNPKNCWVLSIPNE